MTKSSWHNSAADCHCVYFTLRPATSCHQKYGIKIPISTEAPRHKIFLKSLKILNSQNFENFLGPFLGSFLDSRVSCPAFRNSLVAWDLTTSDVSTTFLLPSSRYSTQSLTSVQSPCRTEVDLLLLGRNNSRDLTCPLQTLYHVLR